MAYWYEKENGALLQFEKECFFRFVKEYNHPDITFSFAFDKEKRFCIDMSLPFKATPEESWRTFKFHLVYEHDHPGRGSDGLFGGSIKVYPMTKLKPGFHHLIKNRGGGVLAPYICQVKTANSSDVNAYKVMMRVLRWIDVYCVWERTGVDLDR